MNPAQKFNDELQKVLEQTKYDVEIPHNWHMKAKHALHYASPMSLGISGTQFKEIAQRKMAIYSLYDFAILSNNLERTTTQQLNLTLADYCDLMVATNELTDKWNDIVNKIKGEITARIILEQKQLEKTSAQA